MNHSFQITDTVFTGLHSIVSQIFSLTTGITDGIGLTIAKPQTRMSCQTFRHQRFERPTVGLGINSIPYGTIPPLYSPQIVIINAGKQSCTRNAVLWLCHIIEAGIVHNTGGMSVTLHPATISQTVHRHRTASSEVMTKPKSMADFVGRNKANKLSHQFIIKIHLAGSLIHISGLHHVPVMQQTHDIVMPENMAFQYLTRTGIAYTRTISIGYR